MSYDVSIGECSFNYTCNVSSLFHDHMAGGLQSLDGLTGKQAVERLAIAFDAIDTTRHELWNDKAIGEPAFCTKYDSSNGWGSALGGVVFLSKIMAACARNPRGRLRVSA